MGLDEHPASLFVVSSEESRIFPSSVEALKHSMVWTLVGEEQAEVGREAETRDAVAQICTWRKRGRLGCLIKTRNDF